MTKYCSDCSKLDPKNTKDGKVSGKLYYCKKIKKYINPTTEGCEDFDKTYARKSYENDQIFDEGKKFYDNDTPLEVYVIALIALIILGLIMGVFFN